MDVVTAQEMYEWDQVAIESAGINGETLMESAGRAVANDMEQKIEKHYKVMLLVGAGNNGGDGFVIARTLLNRGYDVEVWQVMPDHKITGEAKVHKEIYLASGYGVYEFTSMEDLMPSLTQADVLIDAMLGIGVRGPLRDPIRRIVQAANAQQALRMAVDIPTGVPADEGIDEFEAYHADYTTIVAAPKMSAVLQHTKPYYGDWSVVDIGLPVKKLPSVGRRLWQVADIQHTWPRRDPNSHKGSHGKALMIGGSFQMPGSVAMSARATLRSGAGLLTIATPKSTIPSITTFIQESTFVEMEEANGMIAGQATDHLQGYDAVAFGMGVGREQGSCRVLRQLLKQTDAPLLIDADGLYHLSGMLEVLEERTQPTVLTPHLGEFAILAGSSIEEVVQSPFSFSRNFAETYGVYLILKGPATIITAPNGEQRVDISGNAGLAKGGSGDVLSGILLSMMMQDVSLLDSLSNGCVIHGSTAELLTKDAHSKVDMLATDLIEGLPLTFRTFSL